MSEHAVARSRTVADGPVLRQVDLSGTFDAVTFRLTDAGMTKVVSVTADGLDSYPDRFRLTENDTSPLLGFPHSGISLRSLKVGPAAVIRAAQEHWQECQPRALSLVGENDDLTWYIFCNLPAGVVLGTVDPETGDFTPSGAPPALPPPTASLGGQ